MDEQLDMSGYHSLYPSWKRRKTRALCSMTLRACLSVLRLSGVVRWGVMVAEPPSAMSKGKRAECVTPVKLSQGWNCPAAARVVCLRSLWG